MNGRHWLQTWDFETIDTAEVAEEMSTFEMEPMNELIVSPDARLMHIVKNPSEESSIWYAQVRNIIKTRVLFSHVRWMFRGAH